MAPMPQKDASWSSLADIVVFTSTERQQRSCPQTSWKIEDELEYGLVYVERSNSKSVIPCMLPYEAPSEAQINVKLLLPGADLLEASAGEHNVMRGHSKWALALAGVELLEMTVEKQNVATPTSSRLVLPGVKLRETPPASEASTDSERSERSLQCVYKHPGLLSNCFPGLSRLLGILAKACEGRPIKSSRYRPWTQKWHRIEQRYEPSSNPFCLEKQ